MQPRKKILRSIEARSLSSQALRILNFWSAAAEVARAPSRIRSNSRMFALAIRARTESGYFARTDSRGLAEARVSRYKIGMLPPPTRRQFLQQTSVALAAAAALPLTTRAADPTTDRLRIGLIGCGGRGSGATAQALTAVSLSAVAGGVQSRDGGAATSKSIPRESASARARIAETACGTTS